ncbi:MAG: hypothetical protein IPH88_11740 [Bacteroidales bacterium]|nr:hypothetical protein [Bacteroidales bacterium]
MGTGAWSVVSGGTGTFSDNTDPDATFTADAYGTYVLRWSISNGTCTASTADVTVNYYQAPTTASVGADQSHCATLTSTSLGGNTWLLVLVHGQSFLVVQVHSLLRLQEIQTSLQTVMLPMC